MRRHLRRRCWFVDEDEFFTRQACPDCLEKMVLIYATGDSPPKIPGELDGPPVGTPAPAKAAADGRRVPSGGAEAAPPLCKPRDAPRV